MDLDSATLLMRRLGLHVDGLSRREFNEEYLRLARRFHPDHAGGQTQDLMANINEARAFLGKHHHWRDDRG